MKQSTFHINYPQLGQWGNKDQPLAKIMGSGAPKEPTGLDYRPTIGEPPPTIGQAQTMSHGNW